MNLADCYQVLGVSSNAHPGEIKQSYRRLARQYHPDVNPGNAEAKAKFIQLTQAYKYILKTGDFTNLPPQPETPPPPTVEIPILSPHENQLKWNAYQSLQTLLNEGRFARAIALVEGLGQRLPQDPEVRQWQAITYQQWGRQLLQEGQFSKGKIYLQKALKTDPHNRSLWAEVAEELKDMRRGSKNRTEQSNSTSVKEAKEG